jgi:hypothetical protein
VKCECQENNYKMVFERFLKYIGNFLRPFADSCVIYIIIDAEFKIVLEDIV